MFRVKICGITRVEDALAAAEAGADAIGLNFYEKTPRHVDELRADAIVRAMPEGVSAVGVFVNHAVEQILDVCKRLELDYIQLHGDEPPETIGGTQGRPVIRSLDCGDQGLAHAEDYLAQCRQQNCLPAAVLVDAYAPGQYGGTGRIVDWQAVRQRDRWLGDLPLVLAGGLREDNVAEAIRVASPDAVDVASGVESSPGVKDHRLIEAFVKASLSSFDSYESP